MNYDEMSIDELIVQDDIITDRGADVALMVRCAVRDAFLDLAEALDAEGLVVVPKVATDAMLAVGDCDGYVAYDCAEIVWEVMIEAAPLMGVE